MQPSPDLRAAQELFWKLITAPEGVERGAADLYRDGTLPSQDLSFLVPPSDGMSSVQQLDIYANMYFHRLRDCLAEDFPKLLARLGDARFHNLATDYLLAHPPSHFSLRELGRALPDFLADHPLARELSMLADLARLEWARVDVFDEADAAPLTREEILERGASEPERFRMALVPASRLLRIDASALPLWKRLDAGERPDGDAAPSGERCAVRVWRKGFAVFHRSIPPDEERCVEALGSGCASLAALGEILARTQPTGSAETRLAERFAALLDLWTQDEILAAKTDQCRPSDPGARSQPQA